MRKEPKQRPSPHVVTNSDGTRIESWKAIARYLNRTVRTTQRWEKHEGLPVHRHQHGRQSSVFAYVEELDLWRSERSSGARTRESWFTRPVSRYAALAVVILAAAMVWWSSAAPDRASPFAVAWQQFVLGMHHLNRGNEPAAIAAFERARSFDPEFTRPLGALALARVLQSGQVMDRTTYSDGRAAVQAALAADPMLPEAHAADGVLALEQGRTADAESALRRALELDENSVLARFWLTVALDEQRRYSEADNELNAALAIDPLHPDVNHALAKRYSERGDYDLARQSLVATLELEAPPVETYHGLIDLNVEFGRLDEALYWAHQLALRKPLYSGLGALINNYARLEMYAEADFWREQLTKAEPSDEPRLGIHCKYLYMRHRIEECFALKEAYLANSNRSLDQLPFAIRETHGGMAILTGRFDEGIAVLEPLFRPELRVPQHLGGSAQALMFAQYLAYGYQATGRHDDAESLLADIAAYLESLQVHERATRPAIVVAEARNYALLGQANQAIQTLRRAAEMGWRDYVYEQVHPAWASFTEHADYVAVLTDVRGDVADQRRELERRGPDSELEALIFEAIERAGGETRGPETVVGDG